MHTFISNLTYGLIATSCTVLFVTGAAMALAGAYSIWFKPPEWKEWLASVAVFGAGLAAIAIALHFTL